MRNGISLWHRRHLHAIAVVVSREHTRSVKRSGRRPLQGVRERVRVRVRVRAVVQQLMRRDGDAPDGVVRVKPVVLQHAAQITRRLSTRTKWRGEAARGRGGDQCHRLVSFGTRIPG